MFVVNDNDDHESIFVTMKEILLVVLSVIISFLIVIFIICVGWYIVWKLFLSRFKFVHELIGTMNSSSPAAEDIKAGRAKARRLRRD